MNVTLMVRVVHETFARDYFRTIDLPVLFPGLVITKLLHKPQGFDPSSQEVESVEFDSATGELLAHLEIDDYREEKCGASFLPAEVEELYQGWTDADEPVSGREAVDDPR